MPTSENVLRFSNRWYRLAMETAVERDLGSGMRIGEVARDRARIVTGRLLAIIERLGDC